MEEIKVMDVVETMNEVPVEELEVINIDGSSDMLTLAANVLKGALVVGGSVLLVKNRKKIANGAKKLWGKITRKKVVLDAEVVEKPKRTSRKKVENETEAN